MPSEALLTRMRAMPGRETVDILDVTPEMAEKWLEHNGHNRDLREGRVVKLASTLTRSEWKLTGDAIVFDSEGNLANGQHRLNAIVLSGITARLLVLRGVEPEAQEVMDQNLPRRLADALKLRGKSNAFVLAAGLKFLYKLNYIDVTGNVNYSNDAENPSTAQCLALFALNPGLVDWVIRAKNLNRALKMRSGVCTAVWHQLARIDQSEAEMFYELLLEGTGLPEASPILLLRRAMINDTLTSRPRMADFREAALIHKTWNYWRDGAQVKSLTWHYGGTQKDPFPFPH